MVTLLLMHAPSGWRLLPVARDRIGTSEREAVA